MRKIHRRLGLFFAPFLAISALTGLLWAYAPYLYLKQEPKKEKIAVRASSVMMFSQDGKAVYTLTFPPEKGPREVLIDDNGILFKKPENRYPVFHHWVMKIHRLEFFGTKKELTAIPGIGLLLMFFTGLFLFKRGLK